MNLSRILTKCGACSNSQEWAAVHPSVEYAWSRCDRPMWLVWIAKRVGVDMRLLTFAITACMRAQAKSLAYSNEVLDQLSLTEAWCDNRIDTQALRKQGYPNLDHCGGLAYAVGCLQQVIVDGYHARHSPQQPANLLHDSISNLLNLPSDVSLAIIRATIPLSVVIEAAKTNNFLQE